MDKKTYKPKNEYLIAIDSDGCVFDTMKIKQKKFFHTAMIKMWSLQKIEKQTRMVAEFYNLDSHWRGQNRFLNLYRTFNYLHQHSEYLKENIVLPKIDNLKSFIDNSKVLNNNSLEAFMTKNPSIELGKVHKWSNIVNYLIFKNMPTIYPFKSAIKSLKKMGKNSDIIVVSQAPEKNLYREWKENNISQYVSLIAGQEQGSKSSVLHSIISNKYSSNKVLFVGDSPVDKKAAEYVSVNFFPIIPNDEEASWSKLLKVSLDKFYTESFTNKFQKLLNHELEEALYQNTEVLDFKFSSICNKL